MGKSTVTGKFILVIFFGALAFISCSKDLETAPETTPETNDIQEDYAISIEEALSSLEDFMEDEGMAATKAGDYIDSYFIVPTQATQASGTKASDSKSSGTKASGTKASDSKSSGTKASGTKASEAKGNVLYAVNFKDDGGYALLAADKRIQEDILAVTDMGSISEGDFSGPILEMVPTENDDLSGDEYDALTKSGAAAELIDKQINRECLKYACRKIEAFKKHDSDTVKYSWKTVKEVPRLINTAWTQSTSNNDIFNKYCPEVGLVQKCKAPAGCVCIAVSQIVAYHEYPSLTINEINIDYPEIKKIYSYDNMWNEGSAAGKEMIAQLCFKIGGLCNTLYGSVFGNSFGFALPTSAKSCLDTLGYKNTSLNWGYDENRVLESLDNGCPVFMSAIAKVVAGHAWVIDGYIKRSSEGTVSKSQTLVHCNWGWHGNCSGYFTSGVFHTHDAEIYDRPSGNTMDERYWYAFNTITCDKP